MGHRTLLGRIFWCVGSIGYSCDFTGLKVVFRFGEKTDESVLIYGQIRRLTCTLCPHQSKKCHETGHKAQLTARIDGQILDGYAQFGLSSV